MSKSLEIIRKDHLVQVVTSKRKMVLASLEIKEWETDFFQKTFGLLKIRDGVLKSDLVEMVEDALGSIFLCSDYKQYDLIELNLDILDIQIVPFLEENGFRLVDTQMTFLTLIKKEDLKPYPFDKTKMHFATIKELEEILLLTHQSLTYNHSFISRFKNPSYFSSEDKERYFSTWIKNSLKDRNTFFVVYKKNNRVNGYFIYKKTGRLNGKQIYKGILTAVAPDFRGKKLHLAMQSFLYKYFLDDVFYLDNTTQLTNFPTVQNHIKSQKRLKQITLIFYRSKR